MITGSLDVSEISADATHEVKITYYFKYIYTIHTYSTITYYLTCDLLIINIQFIVRGINKVNSSDNKESNKLINLYINSEQSILKSCITTALDRCVH